jgi:hypothetical protein
MKQILGWMRTGKLQVSQTIRESINGSSKQE